MEARITESTEEGGEYVSSTVPKYHMNIRHHDIETLS